MSGRAFSAVAFMVIGAVLTLLLSNAGSTRTVTKAAAASTVDIGFSQDMIAHHQQAVTMAQAVQGRVSPSVSQLAISIELNQLKEIGQMQGWLSLWNAPQVPSGPPMTWMATHHHVMPGMASQREVERLGEADGKDLDIWFLQLMIRHHEGGLLMAAEAVHNAALPQVRGLATLMTTEQREENAVMTGLLGALGQKPLTLHE